MLGFVDIFAGDEAFACCVIDALLQEDLPESVTLAYCGQDVRGVEAWMFRSQRVHVVLGVRLTLSPDAPRAREPQGWSAARLRCERLHTRLLGLEAALLRLRLIGGEPAQVTVHVAPVNRLEGLGVTRETLRMARATVHRILEDLADSGACARRPSGTRRLYRSQVLGVSL